jgi:osmoprotectant transport system permease protein
MVEAQNQQTARIPWAALIWLGITAAIFLLGFQVITLRDQQRFPADFALQAEPADAENTVRLQVTNGTFRYDETPFVPEDAVTGTFTTGTENPVAASIFDAVPIVTEITIEEQRIRVTYEGDDTDPETMIGRLQRPIINATLNDRDTITGAIAADAETTLVYTTTDERWQFGRYVPELIPEGEQEVYTSREEGANGSPLAQFLFENLTPLQALTINPDSLVMTYREGTIENQFVTRVEETLGRFYPRASLSLDLWVLTVGLSSSTVLDIVPINTGIPLWVFTLLYAGVEFALFVFLKDSANKLIKPAIRVIGTFLLSWSIYGHEPLWDFLLGLLFPTSSQLVHPAATVIEFSAQHLELVFVSSLITIPAGLLFGIVVTRENFREILPLVNNLVNSGQTVPTIAVVAFMAPIIGFGFWPAIIALVAYGLLPVVRNTIAGLEAVDRFVIDSARGMGMTPSQILLQIELPIASSVIMAGVRTSMVINVGTATLGAFVGSGGLGTPIASGLSMTVDSFIVLGAIPAAALAVIIDYILDRIEFILTPRGLQIES